MLSRHEALAFMTDFTFLLTLFVYSELESELMSTKDSESAEPKLL